MLNEQLPQNSIPGIAALKRQTLGSGRLFTEGTLLSRGGPRFLPCSDLGRSRAGRRLFASLSLRLTSDGGRDLLPPRPTHPQAPSRGRWGHALSSLVPAVCCVDSKAVLPGTREPTDILGKTGLLVFDLGCL